MEFALFLYFLVVVQAARNNMYKNRNRDSIVVGMEVSIEEHPYQVSVQKWKRHHCGGSIITLSHVLTAAHCVDPIEPVAYSIRAGSNIVQAGGDRYDIRRVVRHPWYYQPSRLYDTAVLETTQTISTSNRVAPIPMPEHNEDIEEGSMAIVSGWGDTTEWGEFDEKLLRIDVAIISNSKCNNHYSGFAHIYDEMVCSGYPEGGKDTCNSDSGGPLVQSAGNFYKLVGIASAGLGCARPRRPRIYTRVSSIRHWIKEVTGT